MQGNVRNNITWKRSGKVFSANLARLVFKSLPWRHPCRRCSFSESPVHKMLNTQSISEDPDFKKFYLLI